MLRANNVAYFALHRSGPIEHEDFLSLVNLVLDRIPVLGTSFTDKADKFFPLEREAILARCSYERSSKITQEWRDFLAELPDLSARLNGRLFKARCYVSRCGQESLILFAALHAAIEGADVENFLRSAAHSKTRDTDKPKTPFAKEWLSNICLTAIGWTLSPIAFAMVAFKKRRSDQSSIEHLVLERKDLTEVARVMNVSKQAVLLGAVRAGITKAEAEAGASTPRKTQCGLVDIGRADGFLSDPKVRFQIRVDRVNPHGSAADLVNSFEKILAKKRARKATFQRIALAMDMAYRRVERMIGQPFPTKFYEHVEMAELYSCLPPLAFKGELAWLAGSEVFTGSRGRGYDQITFCTMGSKVFVSIKMLRSRGNVAEACLQTLAEVGIEARRPALEAGPTPSPSR